MTQECLAELVDLEWKSISYLETGRNGILLTKFARICQALEVSSNELLKGIPEPDAGKTDRIKKALARKRRPKSE